MGNRTQDVKESGGNLGLLKGRVTSVRVKGGFRRAPR